VKRAWTWPAIVIGLLVLGVGANLALLVVATSDPGFAVEPDYYAKAVAWDDKRAQDARNLALGWRLTADARADAAAVPPALAVGVELTDAAGRPIDGAAVHVEAFPVSRSQNLLQADLAARGAGRYAASLPLVRMGIWELRFTAARGADRFTRTSQIEVYRP